MVNERPSEEQAADECEQAKRRPSPEPNRPQGGPPLRDGLEQLRDSHT